MTTTERLPLSRDRIAHAALEFIDRNGLPALSMRKLGAQLGVEAMSLYNHVANKDDLLDAVCEELTVQVIEQYQPTEGSTWRDDGAMMARAFRRVALRHPAASDLLSSRPVSSAVRVEFLGLCYQVFVKAGLSMEDAAIGFDTIGSWMTGALTQELGLMRALENDRGLTAAEVAPELQEALAFRDACLVWTAEERFERGLETLLAGLEATLLPPN